VTISHRHVFQVLATLGVVALGAPALAEEHRVSCKGHSNDCLRKAQKTCGGTFTPTASESHAGGLASDKIPGPVMWYSMQFKCGGKGGTPKFAFTGPTYVPTTGGGTDTMSKSQLARFCVGEASAAFSVNPRDISTQPAQSTAGGYSVFGQYLSGGSYQTFECQFSKDGTFRNVF
jgi:hypothetical protein